MPAVAGDWVMSWPVTLPRQITVSDMLQQAANDLVPALREKGLERHGLPVWQLAVADGAMTLTVRVPVAVKGAQACG